MLTHGSLFAGVGGFDLGFERVSIKTLWQVENDPYCLKVLERHWPNVQRYGDIKQVKWEDVEVPDIVSGGFPCQPVSVAGKRKGTDDERWLWPEFARCLRVLRPRYVVLENVPGILAIGFGDVLGDLAGLGYDAEWDSIPAAAFGAPHLRYRVWVVAYAELTGRRQGASEITDGWGASKPIGGSCGCGKANVADAEGKSGALRPAATERQGGLASGCALADTRCDSVALDGQSRDGQIFSRDGRGISPDDGGEFWEVEPDVGRVANGIPARVDRLKCLGNSIVPQVAEWLAKRILDFEDQRVY